MQCRFTPLDESGNTSSTTEAVSVPARRLSATTALCVAPGLPVGSAQVAVSANGADWSADVVLLHV